MLHSVVIMDADEFIFDCRALLSVSMDSSVRMTVIKDKKKNGTCHPISHILLLLP